MTSDGSDTGRQITNFLMENLSKDLEYMQEGLRRVAEKWATARQRWGELPREELEAEFEKIWKGGFNCTMGAEQAIFILVFELISSRFFFYRSDARAFASHFASAI